MNGKHTNFIARVISKETAEEWGLPYDLPSQPNLDYPEMATEIYREQTGSGRWLSYNELVFKAPDDGLTWACYYDEGLTESQETKPWEYEKEITLTKVEPYEIVITKWRGVKEE